MLYRTIRLERQGSIACLTLNRQERGNTIDGLVLQEIARACQELEDDEAVRAVIVSGGEGPVFSAGWDLSGLAMAGDYAALAWARRERLLGDGFAAVARLSKPVIAALNGDAISAGLELALACDVRIAARGARFALPETGWGLIPMGGGTQRLARIVGRAKALELILTGEPIDAEVALRIGLVSKVVDRGQLLPEAQSLAARIAERGPIAVRYAKEAVSRGLEMPLEQALRYETDLTVILQTTEDRAEGVRAFLEKRRPEFKGR